MRRCLFKILTACFIVGLVLLSNVPAERPLPEGSLAGVLEPIRQKNGLPALAGAILTSSGIVATGAAGVRKAGTGVPVTVNDEWHLGSDTKAMTASLIGLLVEHGKLRWESTIGQVFPVIAEKLSPEARKITLIQLLSHRAGLPANANWGELSRTGSLMEQRRAAVLAISSIKLESEPGARYSYSNWGYVVAGAMAERVTGKPWEELITEYIFGPLDMHPGFGGTGTPGKLDQPWGHTEGAKPVMGNGPAVDNPPVMGPAGTVHCTLADWAKFIADQLRGDRGEPALLKHATYDRLHTPPFGGDYALGWLTAQRDWGGGTVLTHAGSNTMNFAVVWIAPKRDFAVLVVSNQGGNSAGKGCDEAAGALIQHFQHR